MIVLFKAGLGLVFLAAFLSAAVQLEGLIGARGLLPIADYLGRYRAAVPGLAGRLHGFPTLLWLDQSDGA
ncbi:MAG TPA: lipase maturation factor family protein, partial [Candidatus Polarisedimenticolia bacterium]|nr:lipase maturation factor family protein [Candidatus Polarisedimenticolia bacterium]